MNKLSWFWNFVILYVYMYFEFYLIYNALSKGEKTKWPIFYIKNLCLYIYILTTLNPKLKLIHMFDYIKSMHQKKKERKRLDCLYLIVTTVGIVHCTITRLNK